MPTKQPWIVKLQADDRAAAERVQQLFETCEGQSLSISETLRASLEFVLFHWDPEHPARQPTDGPDGYDSAGRPFRWDGRPPKDGVVHVYAGGRLLSAEEVEARAGAERIPITSGREDE